MGEMKKNGGQTQKQIATYLIELLQDQENWKSTPDTLLWKKILTVDKILVMQLHQKQGSRHNGEGNALLYPRLASTHGMDQRGPDTVGR